MGQRAVCLKISGNSFSFFIYKHKEKAKEVDEDTDEEVKVKDWLVFSKEARNVNEEKNARKSC